MCIRDSDYLIKVRGMDFVQAVQTIMGNGSVSFPTCENIKKMCIRDSNIADYISDFMSLGAGSDIEYLSADEANALYLELVRNSVSYMVMARLGPVSYTHLTEDFVCKALEHYNKFLRSRADRDSR